MPNKLNLWLCNIPIIYIKIAPLAQTVFRGTHHTVRFYKRSRVLKSLTKIYIFSKYCDLLLSIFSHLISTKHIVKSPLQHLLRLIPCARYTNRTKQTKMLGDQNWSTSWEPPLCFLLISGVSFSSWLGGLLCTVLWHINICFHFEQFDSIY